MKEIKIDFSEIGSYDDFFQQLKEKIELPDHFGDNLDALFDVITGELEMPLTIELVNMDIIQLDMFADLISTMQDACDEVEGFDFSYFMEQFDK